MSEARVPVNIAILTVSDTRDESSDKSGKLLVERLTEAGHALHEKSIRPDDIYQLRAGEVFRMLSYEEIGASTLQSRCVAGVANGTYIFSLPGSSGACATGWDKLIGPQLDSTNQPCNLVDLMPRLLET